MLPQNYEREVIKQVGIMWEIDKEGYVWRIGRRWYDPHAQKLHILSCQRKRAEYRMGNGYLSLSAYIDDKRVNVSAHRLVWQYFFGDIPSSREINHLNGDKSDNRPENLGIVSKAENAKHAVALGFTVPPRLKKDKNPNVKLTIRQVKEIRSRCAAGATVLELAVEYPVGKSQIYNIVNGSQWREWNEIPEAGQ